VPEQACVTAMSGTAEPVDATKSASVEVAEPESDFGDADAEYRAVRQAAGIVNRPDLAQLRLTGRDPVKMLHGLISNDLAGAPAGRAVYAAMLNPKGKMIADLRALIHSTAGGTEVRVIVSREALSGTVEHLKKFIPPMFARTEEHRDSEVIGVYGPLARSLLEKTTGGAIPQLEEDEVTEVAFRDACLLAIGSSYAGGESGIDVLAPALIASTLIDELLAAGADRGVRRVGWSALETLRMEAGRPRYGRELTETTIPTEAYESTGMMDRAISFSKGCYTGQEVIVRIAHRGHVNRALRGLQLGQVTPPEPGVELFAGDSGKPAGRITSATVSPLLGQTIALGYLRREIVPGDRVRVGSIDGGEAVVVDLPFRSEA
jgi:folate-binding protein YgfZ